MTTFRRALLAAAALGCAPLAHAATAGFDADAEGWTAAGDSQGPLAWSPTGGNPDGHVSVTDQTVGGVTFFIAPDAFLGDRSAALGTDLRFDLMQVYTGSASQFDAEDVVLRGAGLTLVYDLETNPANGSWTSYAVPLVAGGWRLNSLGGAAASEAELSTVLAGLTGLAIRAEYRSGADVGHLDNVSLVPEPASALLFAGGLGALGALRRMRRAG